MIAEPNAPSRPGPEIEGCLEACRRCRDVVDRVRASEPATAERVYARVGPHLRHCLDHFSCLFRALDGDGRVDYDARDRDGSLESDSGRFLDAIDGIVARLAGLSEPALGRELSVRQAAAPGGREASSRSNLARELVFLSGHTIHHLAIVRLLCETAGVEVPETLTTAYSTEAYRSGARSGAG